MWDYLQDNINEITIKNKKVFNFNNVIYEYISPYDYEPYFYKNMSFDEYTKNITYLLNSDILDDEKEHFKRFYGKSRIHNKLIINLIYKKKYIELINILIVIKRLENLYDYIDVNKYPITYIIYITNLTDLIKKNNRSYINNLFM